MNIDDMRASWLEAVANGEAEGFSRHFVPDILDALAAAREREEGLREAMEDIAELCDDEIKVRFPVPESQVAGSVIFSLLSMPRNLARKALSRPSSATGEPKI